MMNCIYNFERTLGMVACLRDGTPDDGDGAANNRMRDTPPHGNIFNNTCVATPPLTVYLIIYHTNIIAYEPR